MPTDLLDLLGPPGWCSGCWPHDGDVAGGAVADSCSDFRFGADDGAVGRSARPTMMMANSQALTWCACFARVGRGSERSAEFGSVTHTRLRAGGVLGGAMPTDLLDLLGPPGWCSGCWPHDGDVAGGAVADCFFVISGSGRTMEPVGRWDGATDGVDRSTMANSQHDDVGFARVGRCSKDQRNLAALLILAALTRARGLGGAMPTDLLDLLGPPGWCSGCWPHDGDVAGGAVADSFFVISGSGRTMELGRSARPTMMMSASPGRGGGDGTARPTGSIDQRWQILKH